MRIYFRFFWVGNVLKTQGGKSNGRVSLPSKEGSISGSSCFDDKKNRTSDKGTGTDI